MKRGPRPNVEELDGFVQRCRMLIGLDITEHVQTLVTEQNGARISIRPVDIVNGHIRGAS